MIADLPPAAMSWSADAWVEAGDRRIEIESRTTIAVNGDVVSESWPRSQGRAKGLRRLVIGANGGTLTIADKVRAAPAALVAEERLQYGFYRQLQQARRRAPDYLRRGVRQFAVPGDVITWFRLSPGGEVVSADNVLTPESGRAIHQHFVFDGWWEKGGAVFPRSMTLTRDGQPYFGMTVTAFDAGQT